MPILQSLESQTITIPRVTQGSGIALALLDDLTQEDLLVHDPRYFDAITDGATRAHVLSSRGCGTDQSTLDQLVLPKLRAIYALGGGSAIDIAKYLAARHRIKLIVILPNLSTNAFSTDKACLMDRGKKVTLDAKLPDEIILDFSLLKSSSPFHTGGIVEILSIHTALHDWLIADRVGEEKIDVAIFAAARKLLGDTVRDVEDLTGTSPTAIASRFMRIYLSGHLTNLYGSGRPESASEHIFAKACEVRKPMPHCLAAGLGIALMSEIQDSADPDVAYALKCSGALSLAQGFGITRDFLIEVLASLKPRPGRYTVLDEWRPGASEIEALVDRVVKKYQLKL